MNITITEIPNNIWTQTIYNFTKEILQRLTELGCVSALRSFVTPLEQTISVEQKIESLKHYTPSWLQNLNSYRILIHSILVTDTSVLFYNCKHAGTKVRLLNCIFILQVEYDLYITGLSHFERHVIWQMTFIWHHVAGWNFWIQLLNIK